MLLVSDAVERGRVMQTVAREFYTTLFRRSRRVAGRNRTAELYDAGGGAQGQVAHMLSDEQFYYTLVPRIPLGRIAEPEDLWNAVLFFVSSTSDFVTGQTLYLDGGITATQ